MNLPEINKTYYCYNDGKIKISRQGTVTITELIPFDKINSEVLQFWKEQSSYMSYLFSEETDYFIKGMIDNGFGTMEEIYFVRASEGWYSISWNFFNERLDWDNELTKMANLNTST